VDYWHRRYERWLGGSIPSRGAISRPADPAPALRRLEGVVRLHDGVPRLGMPEVGPRGAGTKP